jgi:lysophospholipase L1-like esterase
MPNVSNFKIMGEVIDVKDNTARASIANLEAKNLTELVVLGDSFSRGYLSDGAGYASPNMSEMIASELQLNLHLYGVNASGYTISGNTFQQQASNAINDTTYDHNKVAYVIVIGGINDSNAAAVNADEASKTLVTTLASAFINAQIVLAPCWGGVSLDIPHEKVFRDICSVGTDVNNINILYDNLKCLIGYYDLMGADNVHPTQAGYNMLAKNIVAMLHGGYIPRGKIIGATAGSGWNIDNLYCMRNENEIRLYGYVTATATITSDKMEIATFTPDSGSVAAGFYADCASTNYHSYALDFEPGVSLIGYEQNGHLYLQNDGGVTIEANTNIAINMGAPILNL